MRSAFFIGRWVVTGTLVGLITIYLWYASDHIRLLLGFPFPLDYGEGPLLAQVQQLLAGRTFWQIYADPAQAPFLVVNYPPLYLVVTGSLARIIGDPLLAGRLIALFGTLASTAALAALIGQRGAWIALLWLTIPVVREWMPLMRVDLLGVALGLWAVWVAGYERLSAIQRGLLAGLLAVGCLLTKPSLIAGPAAAAATLAVAWYRYRSQPASTAAKAAITYITTVGLVGGGIVAGLSWLSNGWFLMHVVAANANRWEASLAVDFWRQQLGLRWPLLLTALIGGITIWYSPRRAMLIPALTYLLAGTIEAIGVGKVGAYANYFFEWYAALIWLSGTGWSVQTFPYPGTRPLLSILTVLSLLYYPPLWDANRLRPAGLIEPSPPRFVLGNYGLWADAQREAAVLAALNRTTTALTTEVRASGEVIFTDLPGLASGADLTARIPVFEFRQLLDQGYVDQTTVLYELVNGKFPLILIDYLGNWLTPEMVAIIRHRYAQDGSLGVIDRYRPVATGSTQSPLRSLVGGGIQLVGVQIAPPITKTYEPGDLVVLNLIWQRTVPAPVDDLTVVVQLRTADERLISQHERPLVYGALPPSRWPESASIDHLQPITLPPALLPGDYLLTVSLHDGHRNTIADPQPVARIPVAAQGGMFFTETGYFVPAPFMRAWAEAGALERGGWPLTPAVPFAWGWLQCFERICLEWREGVIQMRPLGVELYLAETMRSERCNDNSPATGICADFSIPEEISATLGQVLSGEISRNGWIVQWTEYARLERSPDGTTFSLGRLGDETLRLPPGIRYRWPE